MDPRLGPGVPSRGYVAMSADAETTSEEETTPGPGEQLARIGCDLLDVESKLFNSVVGLVITVNIVLQGVETFDPPGPWESAELACTVVFCAELALRLHHDGLRGYFATASHWFDALLVLGSVVDTCALPLLASMHVIEGRQNNLKSMVTFFRSFRILRVMRLFTVFTELSILLAAFGEAMKTVVWIGVIGFVIDYMYAVTMVNVVRQVEDWGDDAELIDVWFGNLWRSMRTFFIIMTLAEWDQIALVLENHMNPALVYLAAIIYILLTAFSLVSLITGILSDKLITAQLDDREHQRQVLEEERSTIHAGLQHALACFDSDGDGRTSIAEVRSVSEAELSGALLDLQNLAQINMTSDDFVGFVELVIDKMGEAGLLEKDRTELPLESLVDALQCMRGPAQAHNLWKLSSTVHALRRQGTDIEMRISSLEGKIDRLCQSAPWAVK